jgi:uncharacterized membrane protein YjdF
MKPMSRHTILAEYWEFLKYRKKFWLFPIVTVLLMLGVLLVSAQTSAIAPLLYMLF